MSTCKHEQLPRSCEMCELERQNAALRREIAGRLFQQEEIMLKAIMIVLKTTEMVGETK